MIYETELSKTQEKLQSLEVLHEEDREIQNSLFEQTLHWQVAMVRHCIQAVHQHK